MIQFFHNSNIMCPEHTNNPCLRQRNAVVSESSVEGRTEASRAETHHVWGEALCECCCDFASIFPEASSQRVCGAARPCGNFVQKLWLKQRQGSLRNSCSNAARRIAAEKQHDAGRFTFCGLAWVHEVFIHLINDPMTAAHFTLPPILLILHLFSGLFTVFHSHFKMQNRSESRLRSNVLICLH